MAATISERDMLRDTMRENYLHLLEMDELVREKLFILQVKVSQIREDILSKEF